MAGFDLKRLYHPTALLTLALMAIIVMMILPMPAIILDLGLAASFALAILIFTNTLFINRPLDFSAFPTILLASLMLRLSLNVSSTKLIIGEGHTGTDAAGGVIEGFAMFVMGGSVFLGLVVFGVLLIVNFIVITKGAGRMAEVGARFALDGMPGRQLAIDADMAAGALSHQEATARRKLELEETTFFGSLDGVSKFVKGDAIAGLLITLLNLVMGLCIGLFVHGMPAGEAFETYAILTVGDGLVSQIPAVIISIATALLLSKGGQAGSADKALLSQLGGFPVALGTVAALMALFALVPGLPFIPFVLGAALLGTAAWFAHRDALNTPAKDASPVDPEPTTPNLGDILDLDEIHVEVAPDLVSVVLDATSGLDARISNMRNHIAETFGLILPEIRLTDSAALPSGQYAIRIQGVQTGSWTLKHHHVLVLKGASDAALPPGEDVEEPVYGAPARWIDRAHEAEAMLGSHTVVAPAEVIATHLMETIKESFGRLFTRRALRKVLDAFVEPSDPVRAAANRRMLDDYVPDRVSMEVLQTVLRLLLEERVSIRNLPLILEALTEAGPATTPPDILAEHVRHRLGFQLVAEVKEEDGTLPFIQLGAAWEALFAEHQIAGDGGIGDVALPPEEFNRLAASIRTQINKAAEAGRSPAIVTPTRRRRFIQTVMRAKGIPNPVLSYDEIGSARQPALLGTA
ncbi:flagellar biosynthesis protein FlhA [Pontivivens insulae]|uniref:Flagellar biosynthesis protein FlhA n=1 Tax=Pontivivens insulae TaxID=1639689 RepID=A0A2R8A9Z4_9RHOB|nr:flagellar biosynthesis protein FlhA [Pontivivens insulae]RED12777.1 flagellar biosynthesis protein FlhA [Pontivivens insulae]SPF28868.1 Flagellar biosynthesis protein FlhA [Pontivivens insulae]